MIPVWQWDEAQQIGTDYENVAEVEAYDSRMREVRDVGAENRRIIEMLQLQPGAHVLEIGTGTGAFARDASPLCAQVTAIDISPVMLEYAAQRARLLILLRREAEAAMAGLLTPDCRSDECSACGACDRACPNGLRPAAMLRCYSYAHHYREPGTARAQYAMLGRDPAASCTGCGRCRSACRASIDLPAVIASLRDGSGVRGTGAASA